MRLISFVVLITLSFSQSACASDPSMPTLSMEDLREKYSDPAGKITVVAGVEIYYKDEGSGPVIMMVHGSQSSLKTWDHIVPMLSDRYRVIRFDVPPQGLSGRVSDEVAATAVPTDIPESLLDQLGIKKVTWVGVSSGGSLGMFLAAKRPDLIERLVLSNTPSDVVSYGHMEQPQSFIEAQEEARKTKYQSQHFWNEFLDYFSGDASRLDAGIREQYYDFNRRRPQDNYLALLQRVSVDHEKTVEAMSKITAPTLLIWGLKDALLPEAAAIALEKYLINAEVSKVYMPDVGHYPPLESPKRFGRILEAYIEAATPELE